MAIESMTGFARHEIADENGARIVCEIRSVNGKSLDVRLKLPSGMERLETQVRQVVQSNVSRGNLQVTVSYEEAITSAGLHIRRKRAQSFCRSTE